METEMINLIAEIEDNKKTLSSIKWGVCAALDGGIELNGSNTLRRLKLTRRPQRFSSSSIVFSMPFATWKFYPFLAWVNRWDRPQFFVYS